MIRRRVVMGNQGEQPRPQRGIGRHELAAGIAPHPTTGLHQLWCHNGEQLLWIAAYRYPEQAWAALYELERAATNGRLPNAERASRYFSELRQAGDAAPSPLQADLTQRLESNIQARVAGILFFELTWSR